MAAVVGGSVDGRNDAAGQGQHTDFIGTGRGGGVLAGRHVRRRNRATPGLFLSVSLVAAVVRVPVSCGGRIWGAVFGDGFSGWRRDRRVLRVVSALSAGAVSHACPRNRAGSKLQFGPDAGGGRSADPRAACGAL